MKLLIVATEPVTEEIVELVPGEPAPDEVRILAPTLTGSGLRYWMNDTDAALRRAQDVATESVEALEGAGFDTASEAVTDDEPAIAVEDALRVFEPDQILVVKHHAGDEAYKEDALVEEIKEFTDSQVYVFTASQ